MFLTSAGGIEVLLCAVGRKGPSTKGASAEMLPMIFKALPHEILH